MILPQSSSAILRAARVGVLAAAIIAGAAQAQPVGSQAGSMRPLVGAGLTYGGDTLASVQYTNGNTTNIKAGSLLALYGGVDWRVAQAFSLQADIGWHMQRASASNGNVEFDRYPLELLAYYHAAPAFRVGGGVRLVTGPKLSGSGIASGIGGSFDSTTGTVVEGEWFLGPDGRMGLKARYVDERYTYKYPDGSSVSFNGSHVGIYTSYYF